MAYRYEWSDGGGIYAGGSALVTDNLIYDNSAVTGGGICILSGRLLNNTLVGNSADLEPDWGYGGNVYASFGYDYTRLIVANNLICNAGAGAGIFWANAGGDVIRFNNVWGNTPSDYGMQDPRDYEVVYGE